MAEVVREVEEDTESTEIGGEVGFGVRLGLVIEVTAESEVAASGVLLPGALATEAELKLVAEEVPFEVDAEAEDGWDTLDIADDGTGELKLELVSIVGKGKGTGLLTELGLNIFVDV